MILKSVSTTVKRLSAKSWIIKYACTCATSICTACLQHTCCHSQQYLQADVCTCHLQTGRYRIWTNTIIIECVRTNRKAPFVSIIITKGIPVTCTSFCSFRKSLCLINCFTERCLLSFPGLFFSIFNSMANPFVYTALVTSYRFDTWSLRPFQSTKQDNVFTPSTRHTDDDNRKTRQNWVILHWTNLDPRMHLPL